MFYLCNQVISYLYISNSNMKTGMTLRLKSQQLLKSPATNESHCYILCNNVTISTWSEEATEEKNAVSKI